MAHVLVMGSLFRAPEAKTSGNGNRYVAATIKCREGDGRSSFWSVRAFTQSVQSELLALREGDGLSVQGIMQASVYQPTDGSEARVSLSVVADNILPAKTRKVSKVPSIKPAAPSLKVVPFKPTRPAIDADLNDECPF